MSYKFWNVIPPDSNTRVTVELGELIENGIDLWAFDYPSYYKDDAKKAFEQKVIDHYRFRQIGQETPARFLHYFRTRVREIMPYYIQLYHSVELMEAVEDPFESYNLTETFTRTTSGSSSSEASNTAESSGTASQEGETHSSRTGDESETTTADNVKKVSNTPQGSIDNLNRYLTEATVDDGDTSRQTNKSETADASTSSSETSTATSSGSSTSSSSDSGNETHTLTRKGNIGVQPLGAEVNALRASFINVDLMIINELNDLFLMVY